MLASAQRLRRERDFRSVLRARRTIRGKFLVLRAAPKSAAPTRYGFVVSRRTAKRAVDRNRVKRRLRHAVHDLQPPTPLDLIVVVQPAGITQTQANLKHELVTLINRFRHDPPGR